MLHFAPALAGVFLWVEKYFSSVAGMARIFVWPIEDGSFAGPAITIREVVVI